MEGEDGELLISIPISEAPQKIPQYYGFSKGRHSGSFFLKIGGAIFCAMHIVHLTLLMAKEVLKIISLIGNEKKGYRNLTMNINVPIFLRF